MKTDEKFLQDFEAADILRDDWTHEAHVRMAWLYLRHEDTVEAAMARARAGIKKLNAVNGVAPELYHETVTRAFLELIALRLDDSHFQQSWDSFRDGNAELFDKQNPILDDFYYKETLESEVARLNFEQPSKRPFQATQKV